MFANTSRRYYMSFVEKDCDSVKKFRFLKLMYKTIFDRSTSNHHFERREVAQLLIIILNDEDNYNMRYPKDTRKEENTKHQDTKILTNIDLSCTRRTEIQFILSKIF